MSIPRCSNHCSCCGGHFTSLDAFDAHRPRHSSEGGCEWPRNAPLSELIGDCLLADPDRPLVRVSVFEHSSTTKAREAARAPIRGSKQAA